MWTHLVDVGWVHAGGGGGGWGVLTPRPDHGRCRRRGVVQRGKGVGMEHGMVGRGGQVGGVVGGWVWLGVWQVGLLSVGRLQLSKH